MNPKPQSGGQRRTITTHQAPCIMHHPPTQVFVGAAYSITSVSVRSTSTSSVVSSPRCLSVGWV